MSAGAVLVQLLRQKHSASCRGVHLLPAQAQSRARHSVLDAGATAVACCPLPQWAVSMSQWAVSMPQWAVCETLVIQIWSEWHACAVQPSMQISTCKIQRGLSQISLSSKGRCQLGGIINSLTTQRAASIQPNQAGPGMIVQDHARNLLEGAA